MRRHPAVVLSFVAVLLVAACGGGSSPAVATASPTFNPTAQDSLTPEPTEAASAEPTASPAASDDTVGLVCTPGQMPNLDTGWKFLQGADGTFALAYPEDWEDLSGEVDFTTATLLDPATFAELGLPSDHSIKADFVRGTAGVPNVSVFHFGPVESSAAEIRGREVARYAGLDDVEQIVDDSIEGCVGGTGAAGLSMEFRSTDDNIYYQQNLFVVRNGELYAIQWLDLQDPDTDLLDEIITTWGWMGF